MSITELAKQLAEDNGIDWTKLRGSGQGGEVTETDVITHLTAIMTGEAEPPQEPVDPPPPDWDGNLPQLSPDLMKQAGIDNELTEYITSKAQHTPKNDDVVQPKAAVVTNSQQPEPEYTSEKAPQEEKEQPSKTPKDDVSLGTPAPISTAPTTTAPAPTPSPEISPPSVTPPPPSGGGIGGLLSRLYRRETPTPAESTNANNSTQPISVPNPVQNPVQNAAQENEESRVVSNPMGTWTIPERHLQAETPIREPETPLAEVKSKINTEAAPDTAVITPDNDEDQDIPQLPESKSTQETEQPEEPRTISTQEETEISPSEAHEQEDSEAENENTQSLPQQDKLEEPSVTTPTQHERVNLTPVRLSIMRSSVPYGPLHDLTETLKFHFGKQEIGSEHVIAHAARKHITMLEQHSVSIYDHGNTLSIGHDPWRAEYSNDSYPQMLIINSNQHGVDELLFNEIPCLSFRENEGFIHLTLSSNHPKANTFFSRLQTTLQHPVLVLAPDEN